MKIGVIGVNWAGFDFGLEPGRSPHAWEQFDYQGRQLEILSLPFQARDEEAVPELGQRLVLIRDRTEIRSLEEDLVITSYSIHYTKLYEVRSSSSPAPTSPI